MYYSSLLRNFMRHLFVIFATKQTPIDERSIRVDGIIGENVGECAVNKMEPLFNVINTK